MDVLDPYAGLDFDIAESVLGLTLDDNEGSSSLSPKSSLNLSPELSPDEQPTRLAGSPTSAWPSSPLPPFVPVSGAVVRGASGNPYRLLKEIGTVFGSGAVWKAFGEKNDQIVTLRFFSLNASIAEVAAEIENIKAVITSPKPVKAVLPMIDYHLSDDPTSSFVVYEVVSIRSLAAFVDVDRVTEKVMPVPESVARKLLLEMISSVSELHRAGIAHRSLSISSFNVESDYSLRLLTTGLSQFMMPQQRISQHASMHNGRLGALHSCFLPPPPPPVVSPLLADEPMVQQDMSADVWNLGWILVQLVTGESFFDVAVASCFGQASRNDLNKLCSAQIAYSIPAFWAQRALNSHLSDAFINLVSSMIEPQASKRISLHDIRNTVWLAQGEIASPAQVVASLALRQHAPQQSYQAQFQVPATAQELFTGGAYFPTKQQQQQHHHHHLQQQQQQQQQQYSSMYNPSAPSLPLKNSMLFAGSSSVPTGSAAAASMPMGPVAPAAGMVTMGSSALLGGLLGGPLESGISISAGANTTSTLRSDRWSPSSPSESNLQLDPPPPYGATSSALPVSTEISDISSGSRSVLGGRIEGSSALMASQAASGAARLQANGQFTSPPFCAEAVVMGVCKRADCSAPHPPNTHWPADPLPSVSVGPRWSDPESKDGVFATPATVSVTSNIRSTLTLTPSVVPGVVSSLVAPSVSAPSAAGFVEANLSTFAPSTLQHQEPIQQGSPRAICKFSLKGGICQLPNCQFYHPPGTYQPRPLELLTQYPRPKPAPGYVCHNCGDTTGSHFKADCIHPQRCRYTAHGGVCTRPHCAFFHPPGTRIPPSGPFLPPASDTTNGQFVPRPRPAAGYVCHNCGDTSLSHFKADCPHAQRCRYTTHGGICTRPQCQFFHPAGTSRPTSSPTSLSPVNSMTLVSPIAPAALSLFQ